MRIGRFLPLLSKDRWTWGAWQLHLRRAVIAASLWLLAVTLHTLIAQPAHAQDEGIPKVTCDVLETACDITGVLETFPLLELFGDLFLPTPHDEFDFRWRPFCRTPPPGCLVGDFEDDPGTDVKTAVNVQTYFWAIPDLEKKTYLRFVPLVACTTPAGPLLGSAYTLTWTPIYTPQWCFGDGNWGISPGKYLPAGRPDLIGKKFPPVQWYEFSSYGQERRTKDNQPAFEVTMITFWKLEIDCVVICYIVIEVPPFIIPYPCGYKKLGPYQPIPICKDHAVAVKQVLSVLVPGPAWPIPQE